MKNPYETSIYVPTQLSYRAEWNWVYTKLMERIDELPQKHIEKYRPVCTDVERCTEQEPIFDLFGDRVHIYIFQMVRR